MTPAPTQVEIARLNEFAMKEVEKKQARRKINFGLTVKGCRKGVELLQVLCQLLAGAPLLVYRSHS